LKRGGAVGLEERAGANGRSKVKGTNVTKSSEVLQRFEAEPCRGKSLTNDDRGVLDGEVNEMMRSITSCDTFEAAEPLLQELGQIQEIMATLAFKHGIQLSGRQREIVREYDRCDLPEVRRNVFQKIKTLNSRGVLTSYRPYPVCFGSGKRTGKRDACGIEKIASSAESVGEFC
jgi:hypothetical protein